MTNETFKSAYQIASELRSQNVGRIFDAIDGDFSSRYEFEYSDVADAIMEMVIGGCEGFVVDICKRFSDVKNSRCMTDKQRWCVAFAFQKISDEVVERVISRAQTEC